MCRRNSTLYNSNYPRYRVEFHRHMQVAVNIRLIEYGHEQVKIRKKGFRHAAQHNHIDN
jgi:hypothetical protein